MKKLIICLLLGFTAVIIFGQANVPTIVVSTFSTRGQAVTADDAESITELFIAELAKIDGLRVVDRSSLDRVVAEMRFQTSDWSNSQKTARLGAALNAEVLVRGQINQLGQQISIAITALDIKTLEVVSSSTDTFDSNIIYNVERDSWGSYRYRSIFRQMPTMAYNIADPIKTKIVQLAEQRKKEQEEREKQQQEQARLQEQSRYSLVGTWIIGSGFSKSYSLPFNNDLKKSYISHKKAGAYEVHPISSPRYILIFSENGTMEYYYDQYDSYSFLHRLERGTYIRKGDQVEYSLSGTQSTLRGRNWSNWYDEYRDSDITTENSSSSNTVRIEFRGGGNTLIWRGMEFKREWYSVGL